jgi:DNA-binding NarL/FixJ family response regulator
MKIRIVLADDHPMIRAGFKSMLDKNERFEIVGEAGNGKELIERAIEVNPDIILVDISMPVMSGLDVLEELSKQLPGVRVIVLTMHEEREYILQALKSGAVGYLLKNIERFELERAIINVYEGGKYFSPMVTNILAEAVAKPEPNDIAEVTPAKRKSSSWWQKETVRNKSLIFWELVSAQWNPTESIC